MAIEKGITVWSAVLDAITWVGLLFPLSVPPLCVGEPKGGLWVPPVHSVQNTVSHVSQKSSSCKNHESLSSWVISCKAGKIMSKFLVKNQQ